MKLYRSHWPNGTSVYSRLYVKYDGAHLDDSEVFCGNYETETEAEAVADALDKAYGGWINIDDALMCVEEPFALLLEIVSGIRA